MSEESEDDDPILEALDAFLRARPAWHTFEAAVREIPSSHFQTLVRSQLRSGLGTEVFVKHRKAEAGMEEADVADVQQGWDPKTISERLGHYKPSFTMDRYAHVTQARHEEVADRLEAFAPTGTGGAHRGPHPAAETLNC